LWPSCDAFCCRIGLLFCQKTTLPAAGGEIVASACHCCGMVVVRSHGCVRCAIVRHRWLVFGPDECVLLSGQNVRHRRSRRCRRGCGWFTVSGILSWAAQCDSAQLGWGRHAHTRCRICWAMSSCDSCFRHLCASTVPLQANTLSIPCSRPACPRSQQPH